MAASAFATRGGARGSGGRATGPTILFTAFTAAMSGIFLTGADPGKHGASCAAVPHRYGHPWKCDSCQRIVTLNLSFIAALLMSPFITLVASSNSFSGRRLTMFGLWNNSCQELTGGTPCQKVTLNFPDMMMASPGNW